MMLKPIRYPYLFFVLAFFLCILPLLMAVFYLEDTIVASTLKKLVFVLLGSTFVALPFAFLRPKWGLVLLIPVMIAGLIEIYVLSTLRSPVTAELLGAIFANDILEKLEFVSGNISLLIIGLVVFVFYISLILFIPSRLALPKFVKNGVLALFLVTQGAIVLRDYYVNVNNGVDWFDIECQVYTYRVKAAKTFPINWVNNFWTYSVNCQLLNDYNQRICDFHFGAKEQTHLPHPKLVVLVIGESARRASFSLYGYERKTTPLLEEKENLIVMTRAEAEFNSTEVAYSVFMSRATSDSLSIALEEPSLIKAFDEAGFYTVYISNQKLNYGSVFHAYSLQADTVIDLKASMDQSVSDASVLPLFSEVVRKNHERSTLVVIHATGSHFRYNLRYPKEFDRFQPSIDNSFDLTSLSLKNKVSLVNSYDNSILFTDYFLSHLIDIMDADTSRVSLMMYASDHGENLFDDSKNLILHGSRHLSRYERDIPLLVWRNRNYDLFLPDKVDALCRHKNDRIVTSHFFHSLLDMADICIDQETKRHSFAAFEFQQ